MTPAAQTPTHPASLSAASVYVYYRVQRAQSHAAVVAIQHMQLALTAEWPGLQTRLMRRVDLPLTHKHSGDNLTKSAPEETWMETYEHPRGMSKAMVQAIDAHAQALPAGLTGERHVETFVPLTGPCA